MPRGLLGPHEPGVRRRHCSVQAANLEWGVGAQRVVHQRRPRRRIGHEWLGPVRERQTDQSVTADVTDRHPCEAVGRTSGGIGDDPRLRCEPVGVAHRSDPGRRSEQASYRRRRERMPTGIGTRIGGDHRRAARVRRNHRAPSPRSRTGTVRARIATSPRSVWWQT